jgi:hypothetical protein
VLRTPDPSWAMMGISGASAAVMLVAGIAYFGRVERGFADLV